MPTLKTYDLFISHAWDHHDDYDRCVKLLDQAVNFRFRNYSVPQHDPVEAGNNVVLTMRLRNQIKPVNCVLILAGMYAAHRTWIQKEIEIAQELGKPMVGVQPWGQQRIPSEVTAAVKDMVGWNTSSIVDAIRTYSL